MNWLQYKRRFKAKAKSSGFENDYIKRCLDYAKPLFDKRLPVIYDQEHLSLLVGYSYEYLLRVANYSIPFYRTFSIPKRSGGERQIDEPLPSLKEIQRWILDNILYKCEFSRFAKAFIHGKSIKENARFHRKQEMVLTLDIKNFFGSIRAGKINTIFKSLGYCKSVSMILTQLCTHKKRLPQGAPTSPALSNLAARRIDHRISEYALKIGIRYTRYADDLTFSGSFHCGKLIRFVKMVLNDDKLELNENKTRLMKRHKRQEVTGVVVNKKMQAPKEIRHKLRSDIYYIEKHGLESHITHENINRANYVNHLKGVANFILFLNKDDRDALKALEVLSSY